MRVVDTGTLDEVFAGSRQAVLEEGYTALKILLFQHDHHGLRQAARIADLVARFSAVRETVGWDIDLGVELHRNINAEMRSCRAQSSRRCGRCSSRTQSLPIA